MTTDGSAQRTASGTPCWVSLTTHDVDRAQSFYSAVLGWSFRPSRLGRELLTVATRGGAPVAGLSTFASGALAESAWLPYFSVEDADETAARVRERGATVAIGPLTTSAGRAALAADRDGASFGIWEGASPAGWAVGRGNAPAWLALHTRDAFESAIFYGEVLRWDVAIGGCCEATFEGEQVVLRERGVPVATLSGGAIEAAPDPQVRPRWRICFVVDDVEQTAAAAREAGGAVVAGPDTTAHGQEVTLRDVDGGLFTATTASGRAAERAAADPAGR